MKENKEPSFLSPDVYFIPVIISGMIGEIWKGQIKYDGFGIFCISLALIAIVLFIIAGYNYRNDKLPKVKKSKIIKDELNRLFEKLGSVDLDDDNQQLIILKKIKEAKLGIINGIKI